MKKPKYFDDLAEIVTTWPFVGSLTVLILNDFVLKSTYSNWLTGKLSDISGLFFVSLLLCAVFPRSKGLSLVFLAVAFSLWKSPISDPVIIAANSIGFSRFGRVVDYSDLYALSVLPLAAYLDGCRRECHICIERIRRLAAVPILVITALAITATSSAPGYYHQFTIRKAADKQEVDTLAAAAIIQDVAKSENLHCYVCGVPEQHATFRDTWITLEYVIRDKAAVKFRITGKPDPKLIFGKDNWKRVQNLANNLKLEFGENFDNMEYFTRLPEIAIE